MSNQHKINYVELPATDLTLVKTFYQHVFDWQFTDYGPEYTAFNNAGLDGGFFASDKKASTETGSALIVLYSRTLEHTKAKVVESGGTIVQDIFSFPGGRRFHFADPAGNELAVWSDVGLES